MGCEDRSRNWADRQRSCPRRCARPPCIRASARPKACGAPASGALWSQIDVTWEGMIDAVHEGTRRAGQALANLAHETGEAVRFCDRHANFSGLRTFIPRGTPRNLRSWRSGLPASV